MIPTELSRHLEGVGLSDLQELCDEFGLGNYGQVQEESSNDKSQRPSYL